MRGAGAFEIRCGVLARSRESDRLSLVKILIPGWRALFTGTATAKTYPGYLERHLLTTLPRPFMRRGKVPIYLASPVFVPRRG